MLHAAVEEELSMLKTRFPGKVEMTLDDYAEYFGVTRKYAPQHFSNINCGRCKINHKRIGRKIIIPMLDFAYWLAEQKVVNGKPLTLHVDVKADMKRRRGFSQQAEGNYRTML